MAKTPKWQVWVRQNGDVSRFGFGDYDSQQNYIVCSLVPNYEFEDALEFARFSWEARNPHVVLRSKRDGKCYPISLPDFEKLMQNNTLEGRWTFEKTGGAINLKYLGPIP